MRVQELKPAGKAAIMGKKKHKIRKQAKENELCPSDSSDEGNNTGRCPHLSKAVNFNTMKKALKQIGSVGQCITCSADASSIRPVELITEDLAPGGATGGVSDVIDGGEMFEDVEVTIWVCLQCGHQGCDRNSKEQHALKHFEVPRSNSHAVVLNVNTWTVWCYTCDDEVNPDNSRKLQECIEFIHKLMDSATLAAAISTVNRSGSFKTEDQPTLEVGGVDSSVKVESKATRPKPISLQAAASVTQGLPKVKGLSNLGNTCFFNAVMQNLSQTYILDTLLSEHGTKGASLNLMGDKCYREREEGAMLSDGSAGSDEDDEGNKIELPPVSLSVGDPGTLTLSLISFMREMHNPGKSGTICPNSLFGQVCKKAPRFKGFQQQDSHELLRHLLDGMKAEEIKRSQAAILKQFHLAENTNPKKVDEETRLKVKEYGRQAKHTFVDEVFSGAFISTVQCEECHQPSQIYEPFLDISLPILEEKTVRHNTTWNWRKKDEPDTADKVYAVDDFSDKGPSKHQQKKFKRQAKREAKRKPILAKTSSVDDEEVVPVGEDRIKEDTKGDKSAKINPDSRSQSDGEISDADVEDNIESDVSRTKLARINSHEEDEKPSSPVPEKPCPDSAEPVSSSSSVGCNCLEQSDSNGRIECVHADRSDSTGRSEESTLTETSAGESNKAGCSSCNSIASISDSTCKASSGESPFGSNAGLNQPSIAEVTEDMHKMDIGDKNNSHKCSKDLTKENSCAKSDLGSTASASMDNTGETTSTSNGVHWSTNHRSRSSGYSSAATSKSSTVATTSRSQLRLQAKVKAMGSLAQRYQPVSHECSIRSCLNQFTACELLTGTNKFGCETCTKRKYGNSSKEGKKDTVYTNASKQVLVFQPPAILTLHLKRFQQVGFTLRKVNRHVDFPMILDLAPFCSSLCKGVRSEQTRVLYALYGVVEHSGRLTGGHYTAYVKVRPHNTQLGQFLNRQDTNNVRLDKILETLHQNGDSEHLGQPEGPEEIVAPPGKWYYISDSRVTEANETSVLRCQAYLLFYERIL